MAKGWWDMGSEILTFFGNHPYLTVATIITIGVVVGE